MKGIIKTSLVALGLFAAYQLLHYYATLERGYKAIGGEIFIFVLPFVVWVLKDSVKEIVASFKETSDK